MSMMSDEHHGDGTMNDINMTPLIDVMLVLLIIFIVTLPVMNHAVKVDLPKATSQPAQTKPDDIDLSITASNVVLWNKVAVDDAALKARIAAASALPEPAAVSIFADQHVEYGKVASVLSTLQNGGLNKINFVTDPASPAS
jgi:biopolymer transport protein ExbD